MKNSHTKISIKNILTVTALFVLPFFLTGCSHNSNNNQNQQVSRQTLTIWRLKGDEKAFEAIIRAFQQQNPNVKVQYRTFESPDEYEKQVISALASGTGPDVWEIRNDELTRHKDKLLGRPVNEDAIEVYQKRYPAPIVDEMIQDGSIFGLPLALDPLVLYVNTDHLDDLREARGLEAEQLPTTWEKMIVVGNLLTAKVNNAIVRPGFAFGTANNVDRASDILQLLMLQGKTQMVDPAHRIATFDLYKKDPQTGSLYYPGREAYTFFARFAQDDSEIKTWDRRLPYSTAAFTNGQLSFMINYLSLSSQIKALNPDLKFSVAPVPQLEVRVWPQGDRRGGVSDPVHLAKYRSLVMSKPPVQLPREQRRARANLALSFVRFAVGPQMTELYRQQTGLLSPYLSLSTEDTGSTDFSTEQREGTAPTLSEEDAVTVRTNLVTWFKGRNPRQVDQIIHNMISQIQEKGKRIDTAFGEAAQQVSAILR